MKFKQIFEKAEYYSKNNQYSTAIESLKKGLRLNPYANNIRIGLINNYLLRATYFYKLVSTEVDNIIIENHATKVIENGQLFIIRNGVKFDATGSVVR